MTHDVITTRMCGLASGSSMQRASTAKIYQCVPINSVLYGLYSSAWPSTDINEVDACCYQHTSIMPVCWQQCMGHVKIHWCVAFQHTPRYSTLRHPRAIWSKISIFFHLSGCPSEFAIRFGMQKTGGSRGLPDGENIFIRFDTTHESNGRTDTARCALACSVAGLQSHGKNWWKFSINLSNNDYA